MDNINRYTIGAVMALVGAVWLFTVMLQSSIDSYYDDIKKEADHIVRIHPQLQPEYDMYMADGKIDSDEIIILKKSAVKELKK